MIEFGSMNKGSRRPSAPDPKEALEQTQRLLAWSAYQESLKEVDQKALRQFQLTVTSLRTASWDEFFAWQDLNEFVILGANSLTFQNKRLEYEDNLETLPKQAP